MPLHARDRHAGAARLSGRGRQRRSCPAARASSASCRTTRRSSTTLGVGELRIRKGGAEESFAIVGGFLQVRPDKVVVMAETADLASEIDLEKAQEARREAERALEPATTRAPTWRRRARRSSRRCCGSASPSGATARVRGTAA